MKKVLFALLAWIVSTGVFAEIVNLNGLYYSLGTTTAQVAADQSSDKSVYSAYIAVTIPATVTYNNYTYPVTSIGTSAFEGCSNLQSVTLPASIQTIGTDAFYGCTRLASVNLEDGLTYINTRAFYNCNLSAITIPRTVTSIGNGAFKNNPLVSITWLPATCSVGTDTDAPFYNTNSQVTSFVFGDSVQLVPQYLCYAMTRLDTVVLPPSVRTLGAHAFQGCSSLKYINLPVTQKTLPISFLEGCSSLETIVLPATLTTISTDVFYGCTNLSNVTLHEGITTIQARAFFNCKLTAVTIPSTVTSIGNGAFKGNPLTSVVWLPATCSTGTDTDAPFYSTNSQVTSFVFGDSVQLVPQYLCYAMTRLDTVVLPPSVSSLGQHAFHGCTSLKSINLPVTQKTLPTSFLEGCSSLTSIVLPATLTTINMDAFYGCSNLADVTLHEGITTIQARAFFNCKLTAVTIPSTVRSIGNGAFKGNPTTSVTWLPDTCTISTDTDAPFYSTNSQITSFTFGSTVRTVPGYLCYNMSRLDTVVLPPSVRSLGAHAFQGCSSLKYINLPVTQKTLPTSFLEGCSSLTSIVLPATLTTINTDAFYGCNNLADVTLHEGLTTIGTRAFINCKLTAVTIPSTVRSIGNGAFKGNPTSSVTWLPATCSVGTDTDAPFYSTNSQVTSFVFGDSVKTVPGYLCANMSRLDTVSLPATVTSIGQYAFKGCSALRGVSLPAGVTSVGQRAFNYCTSLKAMVFPQGIATLATSVLEGCTALETVVIPSSVTAINTDAFYGCSSLRAIYNYAFTPQSIAQRTVYNVNKSTCILYVPMDYIDLYQTKVVWCDFLNIVGMATDLQFEEQLVQVSYLKRDSSLHYMEVQEWQVPHAPRIEGFTFLKWQVLAGDLDDGIVLQAVYTANQPTAAPEVYTNPANPVQKLFRNGQVYILRDDEVYMMNGAKVQ